MTLIDVAPSTKRHVIFHHILASVTTGLDVVLGDRMAISAPNIHRAVYVFPALHMETEEVSGGNSRPTALTKCGALYYLKGLCGSDEAIHTGMRVDVTEAHSGASVKHTDKLQIFPPVRWGLELENSMRPGQSLESQDQLTLANMPLSSTVTPWL